MGGGGGSTQGLCCTRFGCTQSNAKWRMSDSSIPNIMASTQVPPPTELKRSDRLGGKTRQIKYNPTPPRKKPQPRLYGVFSVYDRDAADPEWYWVKWNGYPDDCDDTAQHRSNLERDGLGDLCDHVDRFKEWEAAAEDGEVCTFKEFCKTNKIPRTMASDPNGRCFAECLRRASDLLGDMDYLPDVTLERFFKTHPGSEANGMTWQRVTQLMQLCNSIQKRRSRPGLTLNGKTSKMYILKSTVSGPLDLGPLNMRPGVYVCCVAGAAAGHMFTIQWINPQSIWVYDSAERCRKQYDADDFFWVVRWISIHQVFLGHF